MLNVMLRLFCISERTQCRPTLSSVFSYCMVLWHCTIRSSAQACKALQVSTSRNYQEWTITS